MNIKMKKVMEWEQTIDQCLMKTNHELCQCLVGEERNRNLRKYNYQTRKYNKIP